MNAFSILLPVALCAIYLPQVFTVRQGDFTGQLLCAAAAVCAVTLALAGRFTETFSRASSASCLRLFQCVYLIQVTSWIAVFIAMFAGLGCHTWDVGFFGEIIAAFARDGRLFSSIKQAHPFGDHFSPAILALAPLFKLYPSAAWILGAKVVCFSLCPYLLLRLGRSVFPEDKRLAFIVPLMFLLHVFLFKAERFEFQPSALALPLIILTFHFAWLGNTAWVWVCLVALVLFKEHLPLVWVSVGFYYALYRRELGKSVLVACLGVAIGLLILFVVIPYYRDWRPAGYMIRYQPTALFAEKASLLFLSVASFGFLPALSLRAAAVALPTFAVAFAASALEMVGFEYHYQDVPLTVLSVAAVFGLRDFYDGRGWTARSPRRLKEVVLACGLIAFVWLNRELPAVAAREQWPSREILELRREVLHLRETVPPDRPLWATQRLLPLLIGHPELRSLDIYKWQKPFAEEDSPLFPMTAPCQTGCQDLVAGQLIPSGLRKKGRSNAKTIVITDSAETSSLIDPRLYAEVRRLLEEGERSGKYERISGYKQLQVYVSRNSS